MKRLALLAAVLLAACQAPTPVKPAATRSAAPAAPAAATPTPAAPVATAAPSAKPFRPTLPAALAVVLPGAFNGVISDHGVALVSNNGSGLVANNAGNYRLQASGYGVGDFAATLLNPYLVSRKGMADILDLAAANQDELFAGQTVPLIVKDGKGSFMAMKVLADHAELTAWDDDGNGRVPFCWVSYTDEKHGQAIVYGPVGKDGQRGYLVATRFDLDAGTTTEDVYFNNWFGSGRSRLRYEVALSTTGGQATGLVKTGGWLRQVKDGPPDGRVVMTAHTLADDSGAALLGFWADAGGATGYALQPTVYLGKDGKVIASPPEGLKGIAPAATDILGTLPTDPLLADPFKDPLFTIPR